MNSIICIAGPTASGKTALAVALAKELNGEVVSCDSMQVYRRMDIGTAKPSLDEMQGIPHHMIDVAEPDEDFSVSRYCNLARPIVEDILSRGKTAVIAGGTGLYMDSLIQGNDFAPFPSTGVREKLEQEARAQGIQVLYDRLAAIDPEAAGRLHLSDQKRIIRALEVYLETGETITEHNRKTQLLPPRFSPIWLGLDFENRAELYERIDRRVGIMLEQGLIGEIQGLLSSGIPEKCTAIQAIGYKEFVAALNGECTLEEAGKQGDPGSCCRPGAPVLPPLRQAAADLVPQEQKHPLAHQKARPGRRGNSHPGPTAFAGKRQLECDSIWIPLKKEGIHMTEQVNLQDAILKEVRRDKVPVTLFLMNGFQLRGTITGYDSFVVVLVTDGRQQMIYKHAISTLAPIRPLKAAAAT